MVLQPFGKRNYIKRIKVSNNSKHKESAIERKRKSIQALFLRAYFSTGPCYITVTKN